MFKLTNEDIANLKMRMEGKIDVAYPANSDAGDTANMFAKLALWTIVETLKELEHLKED